jgi:hypothetical protein
VLPDSRINIGGNNEYSVSGATPGYTPSSGNSPNVVKENINFKDASWNNILYPGVKGRCALKQWANKYNVKWDGVNNYNSKFC